MQMISGCGNKPSSKSFEYVHKIFRELQTIANENSFASESDEKRAIFRRMTHLERHLVEPNDAKRIEDREVHAYSHVIKSSTYIIQNLCEIVANDQIGLKFVMLFNAFI